MSGVLTPPGTVVQGQNLQGLISPANAFVASDGTLNPQAFRFLFSIFNTANQLLGQVTTATQGVMTNTTNIQTNTTDIATLQSTAVSLQSQIDTINNRLAAAGIP